MNFRRTVLSGAVLVADRRGQVTYCSPKLAKWLGVTPEELCGRAVSGLWAADQQGGDLVTLGARRCRIEEVDVAGGDSEVFLRVFVLHEAGSVPARQSETSPPSLQTQDIGRCTHDLNNIFTVIYASVDLAMAPGITSAELQKTLLSAQKAARSGAEIVTRIRQAIGREPIVSSTLVSGLSHSAAPQKALERVLLVSGNNSLRLQLRAVLAYRGYDVAEAADVKTAQDRLSERACNLAIVDVEGCDGSWQPLAERSPVLLLAEKAPASSDRYPWLAKPFENAELVARMRSILAGKDEKRSQLQE